MNLRAIAGHVGGFAKQAWAKLSEWVTPGYIAIGLIIVGFALWFSDMLGERTTLGTIVVGSPAIYTRERLVNDRFLQDTWLSTQLDLADIQDALTIRADRRNIALGFGDPKAPAATPPVPGQPSQSPEGSERLPRLSSRALLLGRVDYRDVVRSLIIENQLDDRHDLNGNSLYRFKFDASVLPGANTQASALIKVQLISPEFVTSLPKNIKSLSSLGSTKNIWKQIYLRWIDSLQSRLNQTHRELKQIFRNNEFSHNDYIQLIEFLVRTLNVAVAGIPQCASTLLDPHATERVVVQLSAKDHVARKQCVEAIVAQTVPQTGPQNIVTLPVTVNQNNYTLGNYIEGQKGLKEVQKGVKTARPPEFTASPATREILDVWLNSFFAGMTVKLVLGPVAPDISFTAGYYRIPAFHNLARLTFFNGHPEAKDGNVFQVSERTLFVAGIDPRAVSADAMKELAKTLNVFLNQTLDDFVPVGFAKPDRLRVSRLQLDDLKEDAIEFAEEDFRAMSDGEGIYMAPAEVGLLNFVRAATENLLAFTYGVTPKESADSVDLTLSSGAQFDGQAPGAPEGKTGSAQMRRDTTSRSLERRTAVVGFAGAGKDRLSAEFGWVISPRQTSLDGVRQPYVQMPAQYALSALVSIPSWWNKAKFHVTTSWVGRDGTPLRGTSSSLEYVVDVPIDFEPLEALLLGIGQIGPELMELRLDPIVLTACRPGAIVIPGRRLWRSTKVTLGYQMADSISVLPNMKGIVARFDKVQNQMSLDEQALLRTNKRGVDVTEIQRTVRVWTSQGSLSLPQPAHIGVPTGTPLDCAELTAEKPAARKAEVAPEKSATPKPPAPGK